jgi:hypothetical protein
MDNPSKKDLEALRNSLNSYLELMKHYRTYNIRKKALLSARIPSILKYGYIETVPGKNMKYCLKRSSVSSEQSASSSDQWTRKN